MWRIEEHRRISKQLHSAPLEIQKRYEKWQDIAAISGPPGLRAIRGFRELQELSQNQLAELTGIPQTTISGIENDRVRLGVERAKVLARALKCHPAVLVFPGWDLQQQSAA